MHIYVTLFSLIQMCVCVCMYVCSDVAEWMLNRGITQCEVDTTDGETAEAGSNAAVEYSFQFLEDFQDQCPTLPGMRLFRTSDSPR